MAEANPKVMDIVEAELKKNPDASNPELLEKAKSVDPSVGELTPRQFNATYPLQVKRAMKARQPTRRKGGRSTTAKSKRRSRDGSGRDRVRKELLSLAKDIADAEGKGDVVDIVAGIDRYVDRVMKASS